MRKKILNLLFYILSIIFIWMQFYFWIIFFKIGKVGTGWILPSFVILTLACVNYLILNPLTYPANEKAREGNFLPRRDGSDVLLVTNEPVRDFRKTDFNDADWGYSWINFLEKEFGYYGTCSILGLDKVALKETRIIILAEGTDKLLNKNIIHSLERFIFGGGVLIVETPSDNVQQLTGIKIEDNRIKPKKINFIDPLLLKALQSDSVYDMPLYTFLYPMGDKEKDIRTLLEMDSFPAVCLKELGRGMVVSIVFNLSLQWVSLRQGVPSSNWRVKPNNRLNIRQLNTNDLLMHRQRNNCFIPYADVCDKILMSIINYRSPFPRWWYYPNLNKASVIITHDEDYISEGICKLSSEENKKGIKATFFILADSNISKDGLRRIIDNGHEIAIHWNRFLIHIDNLGVHINKFISLSRQLSRLKEKLPQDYRITSCRIHWLRWDKNYDRLFMILEENNIRVDTTYGAWLTNNGYLFGTGFPFHPLCQNGGLFNLLEFPFVLYDAPRHLVERILQVALRFSSPVVMLYHPHFIYKHSKNMQCFTEVLGLIKSKDIWVTTLVDFIEFWNLRKNAKIISKYNNNILDIEVSISAPSQVLCIPYRHQDRYIDRVVVDGIEKVKSERENETVFFLLLPQGRHAVSVGYR